MSKYIVYDKNVRIMDDDNIIIDDKLPLGTYIVDVVPMSNELYLKRIDNYKKPELIFGDVIKKTERIIHTFEDRITNTGVLLHGLKGSGKTFLSKYISYKMLEKGYSTIIVDNRYHSKSLINLIQSIKSPCMVLFDEFEKIYDKETDDEVKDPQESLLSLLDGIHENKKLFVFCVNDYGSLNSYLLNRPGRIFYKFEFNELSDSIIQEYCNALLKDKSKTDSIVKLKNIYRCFSFDILKSLVEEINRYGEEATTAIQYLNIEPADKWSYYSVFLYKKDTNESLGDCELHMNPLSEDGFSIKLDKNDHIAVDTDDWTAKLSFNMSDLVSYKDGIYEFQDDDFKCIVKMVNKDFNILNYYKAF